LAKHQEVTLQVNSLRTKREFTGLIKVHSEIQTGKWDSEVVSSQREITPEVIAEEALMILKEATAIVISKTTALGMAATRL